MRADEVARVGYLGMLQGRPVVAPGLQNRLTALLVRLSPHRLVLRVVRRLHAPA